MGWLKIACCLSVLALPTAYLSGIQSPSPEGEDQGILRNWCNNRNICGWGSWKSWSQCSRSCGGGQKERTRKICCRNRHKIEECMDYCGITSNDWRLWHQSTGCNEFCNNGGTFQNSRCRCREANFDSCCGQTIDCGHPGMIDNGDITGSRTTFGSTITHNCFSNFNLTDGDFLRECSRQSMNHNVGYWSGEQPRCAYVNSCASAPCKNGASCENQLDTYRCHCALGFDGTHCKFDILPPTMEDCPKSSHHRTRELLLEVGWDEPKFYDPLGNDVTVVSNVLENPSEFPWGEHTVQITGTKENNGLSTKCLFTETVKPYPCDDLPVPMNGSVACNGWHTDYARVCAYFCNEAYTAPIQFDMNQLIVCVSSGKWLPTKGHLTCSVPVPSFESNTGNYFQGDCNLAKSDIQHKYIELLMSERSPFHNICKLFPDRCRHDNVVVFCP